MPSTRPVVQAYSVNRPVAPSVTAVVVTNGLTPFLPETLACLAAQTARFAHLVVVNVAAADTMWTVKEAIGTAFVDRANRPRIGVAQATGARNFGAALRTALDRPDDPAEGWLWLLHDDSAPEPTALAELLSAVDVAPSVAVAGPKQVSWTAPRRVLEVGITTTRFGRRITGVDPAELDQGQHDSREDVLAVGLAGALVKQQVWFDLGGTDPALGPFADGLDLGIRARLAGHRVIVVPTAVVRHAQATYYGLRRPRPTAADPDVPAGELSAGDPRAVAGQLAAIEPPATEAPTADQPTADQPTADSRRSLRPRRTAEVHLRLVHSPALAAVFVAVFALLGGFARAMWRLIVKEPDLVTSELLGPIAALRPTRIVSARRHIAATRKLTRHSLTPLLASWRQTLAVYQDRIAAKRPEKQRPKLNELELAERRITRSRRRIALALVTALLAAITFGVLGSLLPTVFGGHPLVGGGMAGLDTDLPGLWQSATSGWVTSGFGVPGPADPLLLTLTVPTALAGGSAQLGLNLSYLLAIMIAGLGAWFAAGAVSRSIPVRVLATLMWVAAPALLTSVSAGRFGAALAHAVLPWFALAMIRAIGVQVRDVYACYDQTRYAQARDAQARDVPGYDPISPLQPQRGSLAAAAAAGLLLATIASAAPMLLLPLGVLAAGICLASPGRRGLALAVLALPIAVMAPLLLEAFHGNWRVLFAEPGPLVAAGPAPGISAVAGWPTQPATVLGMTWPTLVSGLVLLGFAVLALVRTSAATRTVRLGWVIAAIGWALAFAASQVTVGVVAGTTTTAWPGPAFSLVTGGLLVAAAVGFGGEPDQRFGGGPSQGAPLTRARLALATIIVLAPAGLLATWLVDSHTADGSVLDLQVQPGTGLPAAAALVVDSPVAPYVLVLGSTDHVTTAELFDANGPQFTQAAAIRTRELTDLTSPSEPKVALATVAAQAISGTVPDVAHTLAGYGIGAIIVDPNYASADLNQADVVAALANTEGLAHVSTTEEGTVFRVAPDGIEVGWATLIDATTGIPQETLPVAADGTVTAELDPPVGPRRLVLAETADVGWVGSLDGVRLVPQAYGWQQSFLVDDGGTLRVEYAPRWRAFWLTGLVFVAGLTVLAALPVRRRTRS